MGIDVEYGISIWDMVYRYGHPPYPYRHPGYPYGIWANDMGDDSIDMDILDIDMGYLVTLSVASPRPRLWRGPRSRPRCTGAGSS